MTEDQITAALDQLAAQREQITRLDTREATHYATHHDVATPDMIRQLPAGFALVIRGDCAPVIARLPRAWNNPAYRRARRRRPARPAPPQQIRPAAEPRPDIPDDTVAWPSAAGASFLWGRP